MTIVLISSSGRRASRSRRKEQVEGLKAIETVFVLQETLWKIYFNFLQSVAEKGVPTRRIPCEYRMDECFVKQIE